MFTSFLGPSSAVEIPAIKWIHMAYVFFACHFLLILLSKAARKWGRESLAHFLIDILPHKQPLFLIGIWDNGAWSVLPVSAHRALVSVGQTCWVFCLKIFTITSQLTVGSCHHCAYEPSWLVFEEFDWWFLWGDISPVLPWRRKEWL